MARVSLRLVLVAAAMVAVVGCQTTALRVSTTAQSQSVTEFYYQQVLQNLAYLHDHPDGLPSFSTAGNGQTAIGDTVSLSDQVGWDLIAASSTFLGRFMLDKQYMTLGATRLSTQQWNTQTTIDPDRLALMRCAYRHVLGFWDPECQKKLCAFYGANAPQWQWLHPGWFAVCKCADVPKGTCCVGRCGSTAVWVPPGNMEHLSQFTRVILDMASLSGTHVDVQIQGLMAQANTLSLIVKNGGLDTKQAAELKTELNETVAQLELAMLNKRIAAGPVNDQLCKRWSEVKGFSPAVPTAAYGGEGAGPTELEQPTLSPRLQLNLAPVYPSLPTP